MEIKYVKWKINLINNTFVHTYYKTKKEDTEEVTRGRNSIWFDFDYA